MEKVIEPARIQRLPHDKRGFPIPWNVVRNTDGSAAFTVNDTRKSWIAISEGLCPICGEKLGRWKWFCGGPLSAFDPNGWFLDLPGHRECIEHALKTCPYLSMPKYLGRIDVPNPEKLPPEAHVLVDETVIPERPVVFVAVAAIKIDIQPYGGMNGLAAPYVRPTRPLLNWTFWRHGQQLTDEEALPLLPQGIRIPTRKELE